MDLKTCRKVSGILYVICLFFAIGSFVVPNEIGRASCRERV